MIELHEKRPIKILHAEDDITWVGIVRGTISKRLGELFLCEITTVNTSREAITLISEINNKFDVIILDGGLADKTHGEDVISYIKRHKATSLKSIIALSSENEYLNKHKKRIPSLDKGGFDASLFITMITKILEKKESGLN